MEAGRVATDRGDHQGRLLLILWADQRKGMVMGGLAGDASYGAPLTGPLQVIKTGGHLNA